MRKTVIAVAALAAGTAALTGSAVAGVGNDVATGGAGGAATNNCLNVGLNLLSGLGVAGQGTATGASCAASANGGNAAAY